MLRLDEITDLTISGLERRMIIRQLQSSTYSLESDSDGVHRACPNGRIKRLTWQCFRAG